MVAVPHTDVTKRVEIGVTETKHPSGRSLLAFDSEKHHSVSVRARAFIFSDPRSRALVPLIEKTAPSDANILVIGETGTGKELVARYVHSLSNRAKGPFLAINCGAFSEALIEGELFGYEKGAYTGAHTARAGWFEAASGGTLFLDEIGDLPLSLQVKLLRVLQEREVVRLGSRTPIPLDVRVIAATNVDLQQSVADGNFRADLFYRLQVVTLPLLPLRERRADILPLARHFLQIYGDKIQPRRLDLSAAAEETLHHYSWPGNIRELENAIYRATLLCQEGVIEIEDLALPTGGPMTPYPSPSYAGPLLAGEIALQASGTSIALEDIVRPLVTKLLDGSHEALLDRLVSAVVTETFQQCGSNQIKTAAALGVTRNVVRTHLKNFGLI
ncbi:sigma-54-dependent Fis family transcriptional regulator [Sphingomonas paeninsulae]|uniref:Sigma-54-dependent Fis family transcriptional regulator n=1 Tax=Sphingomonas paeninsulae TaxID=2319844 RepID=A0A494TRI1_SPHPE|nr:sigma-54 dependent transcriptional regulator [Sphingomonas paeninsulae]AYJ87715.1 sigma-54-dependent Fis family transcriptional regulator [Sphingomonas paeninsulae]